MGVPPPAIQVFGVDRIVHRLQEIQVPGRAADVLGRAVVRTGDAHRPGIAFGIDRQPLLDGDPMPPAVAEVVLVAETVTVVTARWNQFADELGVPALQGGVTALKRIEHAGRAARIAHRLATEFDAELPANQPHGVDMTPETSLYDLAARVFAAHQAMLREHFRCVPPVIAYSNRAFYGGKILPIRIARASERIDLPLVDLYVPHGVRGRQDINEGDAQAIADEIEALLADPRFEGRSLGVVTLLGGQAHARRVDEVVRQRCDAAELMRREFAVGDAPTFQGSERDIMFLTMVVDRDNCHANAGLPFEQRLALCESGFEREVFTALTSRGYRVTPQVPAGGFRIDLVVEGALDRRLAIECDGDAFHGPEQWEADVRRQRVLGWRVAGEGRVGDRHDKP